MRSRFFFRKEKSFIDFFLENVYSFFLLIYLLDIFYLYSINFFIPNGSYLFIFHFIKIQFKSKSNLYLAGQNLFKVSKKTLVLNVVLTLFC